MHEIQTLRGSSSGLYKPKLGLGLGLNPQA